MSWWVNIALRLRLRWTYNVQHIHVWSSRNHRPGRAISLCGRWLGFQPLSNPSLSIVVTDPIVKVISAFLFILQGVSRQDSNTGSFSTRLERIIEIAPHIMLHRFRLLRQLEESHTRIQLTHFPDSKPVGIGPDPIYAFHCL